MNFNEALLVLGTQDFPSHHTGHGNKAGPEQHHGRRFRNLGESICRYLKRKIAAYPAGRTPVIIGSDKSIGIDQIIVKNDSLARMIIRGKSHLKIGSF
ncbi:hypothetical protein SAMN02745124_02185 [Desulfofustis glycolicus DSM 9705]|uniref:Uncharacterized protein n=1 Tax=Desulfofustis glycolicus DSM 9705 TaxID=1121409 RepID=A0A1M5W9X0_9BACT|nr:hypothetical protein SAMN02745124_02185 [Desulfofustis glycolicus DSM 9705]